MHKLGWGTGDDIAMERQKDETQGAPAEGEQKADAKPIKNVLLTGGSGFVGGYIVRELVARGYHPRFLVRDPSSFRTADGIDSTKLIRTMPLMPLKPYFHGTTSRIGAPFWFGSASP